VSGQRLDPENAGQIPANMVGRLLDDDDLRKLHRMLVKKKPPAPSMRRKTVVGDHLLNMEKDTFAYPVLTEHSIEAMVKEGCTAINRRRAYEIRDQDGALPLSVRAPLRQLPVDQSPVMPTLLSS
jgi:hypothetical protein